MSNYYDNYLNKRPQNLCKMCGKCCRIATTSKPYSELLELAKAGDEGAIDFLSIFVPYPSLEAAREADAGVVDNIVDLLKADNNYEEEKLTFYCCKYIGEDNLCGNYENRLTLCHHFPSSPWAVIPPDCGFEGWLFWKREEDKQKVRRSKEQLLELQILKAKNTNPEILEKIESVEKKIHRTIDIFRKYGSELW